MLKTNIRRDNWAKKEYILQPFIQQVIECLPCAIFLKILFIYLFERGRAHTHKREGEGERIWSRLHTERRARWRAQSQDHDTRTRAQTKSRTDTPPPERPRHPCNFKHCDHEEVREPTILLSEGGAILAEGKASAKPSWGPRGSWQGLWLLCWE